MSKFYFCFTLDTEPDNLWANEPIQKFEHVSRLPAFHRELIARGARPTYLTTSEIVEDPASARILERLLHTGSAEIGAHFHSWTRKWPFSLPDLGDPPLHANAHQLGQEYEEQMLEFTCGAIESRLGFRPRSFRGGRWSLAGSSVRSLARCGILVDSTVTPGISWESASHPLCSGPDFRAFPTTPFYLSGESLKPQTHGEVLELPVGSAFIPDRSRALHAGLGSKLRRRFWRGMRRPYGHLWLRPTLQSSRELRECLRCLRRDEVPVWVAMIHSSEIIPCKYFPTIREVAAFQERCLRLVEDAVAMGAECATLTEVWKHYEKADQVRGSDKSKRVKWDDSGVSAGQPASEYSSDLPRPGSEQREQEEATEEETLV